MRQTKVSIGFLIASLWLGLTAANIFLLPVRFLPEVRVESVMSAPLPLVVRAPATLEPKLSVILKSAFDAPVMSKKYQEGKLVPQGQLLIELSRERIRPDYEGKQIALKNAGTDLNRARKDVLLQKALYKKQAVSLSSVEDAQRAVIHAEQTLVTAQSAFRIEEERWKKNKIYAPFSGTVVKDGLLEDREVTSGKELLTLSDLSEYSLRARVDEVEISEIKIGQAAEVKIQAYGDQVLKASVIRIGSQAEGSALPEIPVYLQLDSMAGISLLPKLTAEIRIRVGQTGNILSVPLSAIDNADGKSKVWVIDDENRARLRPVTLGHSNPDRVEITQGLSVGERVCVQPPPHLLNGMKVKLGV